MTPPHPPSLLTQVERLSHGGNVPTADCLAASTKLTWWKPQGIEPVDSGLAGSDSL